MFYMIALPALIAFILTNTAWADRKYVNSKSQVAEGPGLGTKDMPFKYIKNAVKTLSPGDELIIMSGTYREQIELPSRIANKRKTIIRAETKGKVIIKGSVEVTGWKPIGSGIYVKQNWDTNSQQVFFDSKPLQQIGGVIFGGYPEIVPEKLKEVTRKIEIWPARIKGGVAALRVNSFYYDLKNQALYIRLPYGIKPEDHVIEVSIRNYLIMGHNINGIRLEGLIFRHANTSSKGRHGAVTIIGDYSELIDLNVEDVDGIGIHIKGNDNLIINCSANYCGIGGIAAKGYRNNLIGNTTNYNNTRGFNNQWEAGGAKFIGDGGLRDSVVKDHRSFFNQGDGLWFDWKNENNTITECIIGYNTGHGIHYEASKGGLIYCNYVHSNMKRGIYLPHSSACTVAHNLVMNNGLEGVVVIDTGRVDPEKTYNLRPQKNRIIGNIIAWNNARKSALILPENMRDNYSDYNVYIANKDLPLFSLGWPKIPTNPIMRGLEKWRVVTGNDQDSVYISAQLPEMAKFRIDSRKQEVPWGLKDIYNIINMRVPRETTGLLLHEKNVGTRLVGPFCQPESSEKRNF